MKRVALVAVILGAIVLALPFAASAGSGAAKAKSGAMAQYLVISPHTPEECLKALDAVSAKGDIGKWQFGCEDGDHTGYRIVNAASAEAALANVPEDVRGKARAIKMHRFTVAELKAAHEHMASGQN